MGALAACAGACSTSVDGNHRLAVTPTTDATSVPTRYKKSTGRTWVASPGLWLLMAAITKMNTSTGATALRAEMNSVPKMATLGVAAGNNTASAMPAIMAITICVTRLVRCAQRSGLKIMVLNKGKTGQWPRQHVHKTAGAINQGGWKKSNP